MITDKPSIADLQAGARRRMGTTTLQDYEATGRDLIAAAPVLLEIAAAALAYESAKEQYFQAKIVGGVVYADLRSLAESESVARAHYKAALAKVRP